MCPFMCSLEISRVNDEASGVRIYRHAACLMNAMNERKGIAAARSTALSILASLKRELGDLDRVTAWLMVYGMVNADPGYAQTTNAINGFSDLILDLYGPETGQHARMAVGMATLPVNNAVTIAAEVEFAP